MEVQSPTWFSVDRVEIYRNGELIREYAATNDDIVNLSETFTETPESDSWYVVIVMGDDSLEPLFTPVEYAPVQLQDVVVEALGSVDAVASLLTPAPPVPRTFPVYPFAITNPIYIDTDGNGRYDATLPPPAFCSRPCSASDPDACPEGQVCLQPERVCGIAISGGCRRREARGHSH